ncbi:MAG: DUF423 domain-containing protein [Blastocatellia bacterium]|jgi:uncharacterized membrane protein YgdD (TMEM256/DUF423 family)|nr:DUF423 domain-containing protein [Blastocatellia bacterium]MBL9041936.1 DUF423 domain-containing protein [Myxococcales bacterium]
MSVNPSPWLMVGALSGFVSVAGGAFGAHALKQKLPPDLLTIFEVGVRYQMYHALLLCLIGMLPLSPTVRWAGVLSVLGTVLFSGSLYVLALSGVRWLGAITPLGGLCFLGAWLAVAVAAYRLAYP